MALIHAQGAQIYERTAGDSGQLTWQFREPVASLLENGRTVGRHYAGPTWELDGGSRVTAKVTGRAPGATAGDIPLLKPEASSNSARGVLSVIRGNERSRLDVTLTHEHGQHAAGADRVEQERRHGLAL